MFRPLRLSQPQEDSHVGETCCSLAAVDEQKSKRERGNAPSYLARLYILLQKLLHMQKGSLSTTSLEKGSMFFIVALGTCNGPSPDQSRLGWS